MAELIIYTKEIKNNIKKLSSYFEMNNIEWGLVTKVFSGDIKFVGITSEMTVIDEGDNKLKDGKKKYKVDDTISFKPNYMAVARLLNSKFIDKRFI